MTNDKSTFLFFSIFRSIRFCCCYKPINSMNAAISGQYAAGAYIPAIIQYNGIVRSIGWRRVQYFYSHCRGWICDKWIG